MGQAESLAKEEAVRLILDVLASIRPDADPSKHVQQIGTAITRIGEVLEGKPLDECRRVVRAAYLLSVP